MATITTTNDQIIITDGDFKTPLLKTNITSIDLKAPRDVIIFNVVKSGAGPNFYKIKFDDITAPDTDNINELHDLLLDYWAIMSGDYQTFSATASQTAFVVTDFSLNDNYKVFINGAFFPSGHSRSGNTVNFNVGLPLGTEVVIMI